MNPAAVCGDLHLLLPGRVKVNEPLKEHTSWKIGGPADIFVEPAGRRELQIAVSYAHERGIPLTVIGNGTNLLVSDRGIRGIVVKIGRELGRVTVRDTEVTAEAGASLARVAAAAFKAGLAGFAFSAGIPGTVGGAVVMNAGAFGRCAGDVIRSVSVMGYDGILSRRTREEMNFRYRASALQEEPAIVVDAVFALERGDPRQIYLDMKQYLERRKGSHPLSLPNAGSVFKNPPGNPAGKIIEQSGLKGLTVGGAQVSEKHANFIVNLGGAKAEDVVRLIEQVRAVVKKRFDLELETEVKLIGEW
ncbi:MAG: UDP-N-acetylmuramate dehydrogenase [Firmicutes bacterium]|nr:UDP-N-acetylmuramate dehydrogenase [Bacillota bacterium]